jgi:hypothetical protein
MSKITINEEVNRIRKIMGINEAEDFDISMVDNPNAYTDDIINHNAERGNDPLDDYEETTKASMVALSTLSDLQEQAPELAGKLNFVKALIMKMDSKTELTADEIEALQQGDMNEGEAN